MFETGIFPDICKVAKVVPKYETRLLCNNYRPSNISLLSNTGKIIEKLMHERPNFSLEQCNFYYLFQIGFRLNYSTSIALISIVENIQTQLNNSEIAAGAFVDLRKSFDAVDHRMLLQKLQHYGVRGISKKWFSSYVTNRKQFVSIGNCNSSTKTVLTDVPQGSVLRPLLFLKYTNDQHKCVEHSKAYNFADDTNILQSGKSLDVFAKKIEPRSSNLMTMVES